MPTIMEARGRIRSAMQRLNADDFDNAINETMGMTPVARDAVLRFALAEFERASYFYSKASLKLEFVLDQLTNRGEDPRVLLPAVGVLSTREEAREQQPEPESAADPDGDRWSMLELD